MLGVFNVQDKTKSNTVFRKIGLVSKKGTQKHSSLSIITIFNLNILKKKLADMSLRTMHT